MRATFFAFAVLGGLAAAKRGCRHDHQHPGWGWYWVVEGDTLESIAADFGDIDQAIADRNGLKNKDFVPAWFTIVVKCS